MTEPWHEGWFARSDFNLDIAALLAGHASFSLLDLDLASDTALGQIIAAAAAGTSFARISIQGVNHAVPGSGVVLDLSLGGAAFSAVSDSGGQEMNAALSFTRIEMEVP